MACWVDFHSYRPPTFGRCPAMGNCTCLFHGIRPFVAGKMSKQYAEKQKVNPSWLDHVELVYGKLKKLDSSLPCAARIGLFFSCLCL